jgi:hypothetical protein
MQKEYFIAIHEFCTNHNIEKSFVDLLEKNGLIEIVIDNKIECIHINQIRQLEKYIQFYYELDINLEGIESITHMLRKITSMQQEIIILKNRLLIYES